jgi:transcriptional regulator with XRE-family HTH domain
MNVCAAPNVRELAVKRSPNSIDKHVGSRVRHRRTALGVTQEKLAEALGLTFQQVQKYEKGINRIGAGRLQAISRILDAPLSYFYDGSPASANGFGDTQQVDAVTEIILTAEGVQLVRAFTSIEDSRLRKSILDVVLAAARPGAGKQASKDSPGKEATKDAAQ